MGCCCAKPKIAPSAGPTIIVIKFKLEGLDYSLKGIVPPGIHGTFNGKRHERDETTAHVDRGCCGGRCCTCCKCCDKHKYSSENLWTEIDYTGQYLNDKPHGRGVLTETMSTGKVTKFYLEFEKGDPRHCVKTCTDGSGFRGQLHYTDGFRHGATISNTGDLRVGKFPESNTLSASSGKQRLFDLFGMHNLLSSSSSDDDGSELYDTYR